MDSNDYENIMKFMKEHSILDPSSIHGPEHWRYVERNGLLLARMNGADETVIKLFSLFHDCRRYDDGYDCEHGQRGAETAVKMRGKLYEATDEQFHMLVNACFHHTITHSTGILTIDTCFDADRLDLPRAGYIPNPAKMATEHGAKIAELGIKEGVTIENYREWLDTIDIEKLK